MKKIMMFCLIALMVTSAQAVSIDKSVSATEADLGDIIEITLDVVNDTGGEVTVEDVLPDALKYIPGTFEVDAVGATPTVVGNVISTTVADGESPQITFDVQVVEAPAEEEDVTNVANVISPGPVIEATDDVDIEINPYEGFEKTVVITYGDGEVTDGVYAEVTEGELVGFDMTITIPNNFAYDITDALLKDNLGAELGVAGDGVDNDQDKPEDIDENEPGDLDASNNTLPAEASAWADSFWTTGSSNKVHIVITGIDITTGEGSDSVVLAIFTDKNPGKKKKTPSGTQEYTTANGPDPEDVYYLNSGATVKFIDPDPTRYGFQLSAHTLPIKVKVSEPEP
jgi:uncharacterized repeat protein (TIGR01451 family)